MFGLEKVELMVNEHDYFALAELAYLVIERKASGKEFLCEKQKSENKFK